MNQAAKTAVGIVCGILVVVGVVRLFVGGGGDDATEREASRLLACAACGEIQPASPEMIRAQYDEGVVKAAPGGAVFVCPSCGESAARVLAMDFTTDHAVCSECGKTLLDSEAAGRRAIADGDVKVGPDGALQVRCRSCDAFHGRMAPRSAPTDE